MKKKVILLALLFWVGLEVKSQVIYKYDKGGNRIYRGPLVVIPGAKMEGADSLKTETVPYIINVFPNPASNVLNIAIQNFPSDSVSKYRLTNISGVSLISKNVNKADNREDMSAYPVGLYILEVWIGRNKKEWKVLKE